MGRGLELRVGRERAIRRGSPGQFLLEVGFEASLTFRHLRMCGNGYAPKSKDRQGQDKFYSTIGLATALGP